MNLMTRGALRGHTLQNGALCLESWQINLDEHVVLALRDHSFDPYVVWTSTLQTETAPAAITAARSKRRLAALSGGLDYETRVNDLE
jgi:hypothetical protein